MVVVTVVSVYGGGDGSPSYTDVVPSSGVGVGFSDVNQPFPLCLECTRMRCCRLVLSDFPA